MFGSDEGMKLALSGGKLPCIILINVDVITPGVDFGTNLVFLD